ncbi:geranylgeranylglycerol-phosphate geranylgeranyltransferase [bacterium SCSIO 12643]|nr:geranylgeranylglycerol-phosphate geranylgeranyltransferase [bacterium SCSIO 12643]
MVKENSQTPQITHLFRPLNLLIIGVTMYLLRGGLLKPMLGFISKQVDLELESQIPEFWFALLVLSVILIAAGGYIINDIKDVNTDQLNHGKNPVGSLISSEKAYLWYQITTVSGLILGFIIGFHFGNYNLGIIQLTGAISLWFYSYYFKTEFLVGNLIVAFMVALVPLTVGIYEVSLIQNFYISQITKFQDFNFNFVAFWFLGYSAFVFLLTWIRELIKDIEDLEGDRKTGARTLPIQWGEKAAKIVVTLLYLVVLAGIHMIRGEFLTDQISLIFILLIIFMILFNIITIWMNKTILLSWSSWNKLLSMVGVLYLIALGYIINNELFFNV